MWEVGLWGSKNVGSGTLGSKKCGKWDFQDAVSPPPPPPDTVSDKNESEQKNDLTKYVNILYGPYIRQYLIWALYMSISYMGLIYVNILYGPYIRQYLIWALSCQYLIWALYIKRLSHGWQCDMIFIKRVVVRYHEQARNERVSDITPIRV